LLGDTKEEEELEGKEDEITKPYSDDCCLAKAVVIDLCDGGGGVGDETALVDWVIVESICTIVT